MPLPDLLINFVNPVNVFPNKNKDEGSQSLEFQTSRLFRRAAEKVS